MEKTVTATMLFADLMSSTEMAKNLTLQEYDGMLIDFQSTLFEVISDHLQVFGYKGNGEDSEWSIVGDELRVFLYSGEQRFDVRNALLIALKIKLGWLASSFNRRILREGRLVSRIGVGINCGKVIKGVRDWRLSAGQTQPVIDGYAINVSKRIESESREGSVYKIMVGDSFYRFCTEESQLNIVFSQPYSNIFKGLGQKITVYEVVSFIHNEIMTSMPDSFRGRLPGVMEYAISQPNPEPWIFFTLLRYYISKIANGEGEEFETKAIKVAQQLQGILEYKTVVNNILGWLHTYSKSYRNLETAMHYYDQTLEREPRNKTALIHCARISEMMGDMDLAKRYYGIILINYPDHKEAQKKVTRHQAIS
jgi:class 3 adenylate cyclase